MMTDASDDVNQVLNTYAPIIRRIAKSACYSSAAIDIADLYQVGEIAVLRAIKSYNPSYGMNIKSFVIHTVKQDIYNEAAKFLGIFTVDHKVSSIAAKVTKLSAKGHTDHEIANILNSSNSRSFDEDHVRDLRIAYGRRHYACVGEEDAQDDEIFSEPIQEILNRCVQTDNETYILKHRILGTMSAEDVASNINLSSRKVYKIELEIKDRIRKEIEGSTK